MRIDRDAYMKADAEGKAKIVAKSYGLSRHQMWLHKQSGKYIINHAGIQTIAAVEGILVDYKVISVDGKSVSVYATPYTLNEDGNPVFGQATFGEASPDNNKMSYPFAMAEKRGFDRAVLIQVLRHVGGYGGDFYGEDEADDFKQGVCDQKPKASGKKPSNGDDLSIDEKKLLVMDALSSATSAKQVASINAKGNGLDASDKWLADLDKAVVAANARLSA